MTLIVAHSNGCTIPRHTDEAKRISDTVTLHWVAGGWESINRWMAFRLQDGTSDNMLYDRKESAVIYQKGRYQDYMYLRLVPGGMHICEAEAILKLHRAARNRDFPTVERDLIPRITVEGLNQQIRALGG